MLVLVGHLPLDAVVNGMWRVGEADALVVAPLAGVAHPTVLGLHVLPQAELAVRLKGALAAVEHPVCMLGLHVAFDEELFLGLELAPVTGEQDPLVLDLYNTIYITQYPKTIQYTIQKRIFSCRTCMCCLRLNFLLVRYSHRSQV